MKQLSIIIISYNRAADTIELLRDFCMLDNVELLEEIILLNNHSTEDYSAVKTFIDANKNIPFIYIEAPENLGVSRGRNYATEFAKGEIFVYLDDDVNFKDKDILKKMLNCFAIKDNNERKLGVVSFKVYYSSTLQMQANAFPHKNFEKYKSLHEFLTYYYAGCAHAITKEAWLETGNYPENFFYGMEEYDFSYRLLNKGFSIKYNDTVVIYHKESPLGRKTKAEKQRMMWVNKTKVAWCYLPKKYFYSTAFMWSIEYLLKTGFKFSDYFKGWKEISKIPSTEKRNTIDRSTFDYLNKVEARLWY